MEVFIDDVKYDNNYYLDIDVYLEPSTHKIEIRNKSNEKIFLCDSKDIIIYNNGSYQSNYNIDFSEYQTCLEAGKSCFITVTFIPFGTIDYRYVSLQIFNSSFFFSYEY